MALKERAQNPVIGDQVRLRLYTYNGNQRQNVHDFSDVKIYYLDPNATSAENTDGRTLFETIDAANITNDDVGEYYVTVSLTDPQFVIGNYLDVWEVEIEEDEPTATIEQRWKVYPDLWYTSWEPLVYDFSFQFRPNRFRAGEKKYITVEVTPNVPDASALERYYENMIISSPITISIEMACVECMPQEEDLRLVVDAAEVDLRNQGKGYYQLDTATLDLDCGIYNVWFEMEMGGNKYISEKQQLEIF